MSLTFYQMTELIEAQSMESPDDPQLGLFDPNVQDQPQLQAPGPRPAQQPEPEVPQTGLSGDDVMAIDSLAHENGPQIFVNAKIVKTIPARMSQKRFLLIKKQLARLIFNNNPELASKIGSLQSPVDLQPLVNYWQDEIKELRETKPKTPRQQDEDELGLVPEPQATPSVRQAPPTPDKEDMTKGTTSERLKYAMSMQDIHGGLMSNIAKYAYITLKYMPDSLNLPPELKEKLDVAYGFGNKKLSRMDSKNIGNLKKAYVLEVLKDIRSGVIGGDILNQITDYLARNKLGAIKVNELQHLAKIWDRIIKNQPQKVGRAVLDDRYINNVIKKFGDEHYDPEFPSIEKSLIRMMRR